MTAVVNVQPGVVVVDELGRRLRVEAIEPADDHRYFTPRVRCRHLDPDCVNAGHHEPWLLPDTQVTPERIPT